jgi:hypothetical protein
MHIRSQTNLHQTVVNKVLKALEGRNEIKVVKSIKVRLIPPPGCALSPLTPPPPPVLPVSFQPASSTCFST